MIEDDSDPQNDQEYKKPKSITVEKFAEIVRKSLDIFVENTLKDQKENPNQWTPEKSKKCPNPKPNFTQWFGDWNEQFSTGDLPKELEDEV